MGIAGLVFALFTAGYILGVWASCLVLRQSQSDYEEGIPIRISSSPLIMLRSASHVVARLR